MDRTQKIKTREEKNELKQKNIRNVLLGFCDYLGFIFNNLLLKHLREIRHVSAPDTKCHGDNVVLGGRISFSLPCADFDLSLVICRWLSGMGGGGGRDGLSEVGVQKSSLLFLFSVSF